MKNHEAIVGVERDGEMDCALFLPTFMEKRHKICYKNKLTRLMKSTSDIVHKYFCFTVFIKQAEPCCPP